MLGSSSTTSNFFFTELVSFIKYHSLSGGVLRPLLPGSLALTIEQEIGYLWVEMCPFAALDFGTSHTRAECFSIRTLGYHGLERVGYGQNPGP